MDPLSITASLIAVIGAAQRVTKGLKVLKSVEEAPESLQRLLEDVSMFTTVLQAIQTACPVKQQKFLGLEPALSRAKAKLLEIDTLITYVLTKPGESDKVDRWQWIRKREKISTLRQELQDIQNTLIALVNAGA